MRERTLITILLASVTIAIAQPEPAGAGQAAGRLSGVTQISYGCPGPQRVGEQCEHWSSFARAQFRVMTLSSNTARIVTSDAQGRFTVLLAVGRYRLTPLRQAHTTGGTPVTVTIANATTTWTRIRFQGFPRML